MSTSSIVRGRAAVIAAIATAAAALAPPLAGAAEKTSKPPAKTIAVTGAATHVTDTSALLNASINPNGAQTSYYFQWGPSIAYGSQTPTVVVGSGSSKVDVGQLISGLSEGTLYHYRVVAVIPSGPIDGRDHTFIAGKTTTKLELPRSALVVVGTPFVISGTLTGLDNEHQSIELQTSTYPYREGFKTVGVPGVTGLKGSFSFAVPPISASTDYRVITIGLRPLISPIETVRAQVKVLLHVRTSKTLGLVRLYGTVAPAAVGAHVSLQVHTSVAASPNMPGAESQAKWVSQFATVVKKATKTLSRFSIVVKVRVGGRYRAVVKLTTKGPVVSGYSTTLVLRASPQLKRKTKKKAPSSG